MIMAKAVVLPEEGLCPRKWFQLGGEEQGRAKLAVFNEAAQCQPVRLPEDTEPRGQGLHNRTGA